VKSFFRALVVIFVSALTFDASAKLQVLTELSPPNQTMVNNEVSGSSTELVRMILSKSNLEGDFTLLPWARAYHLAKNQHNALIYSIARTTEREKLFRWIGPVAVFELGFVTNSYRDDIALATVEQARAYRIAVQRNDIAQTILTEMGFDVIVTSDIEKSYQLLVTNKIDFVIDDKRLIKNMAKELNLPEDQFKFALPVPELFVKGYLAANKDLPEEQYQALLSAYQYISKSAVYSEVLHLN